MDESNWTTWQQHEFERERDRDPRNGPQFQSYLYSRLKAFLRFYREDQYEFEFREDFIQLVVSKYFTHYVRERNLFDVVAYRVYEDTEGEPSFHEKYKDPSLWDTRLFWGHGHLVGFELKTSHDEPYRFLDQLPRYAWLFDRVYLVLAKDVPIPRRIPKWVGVMRYEGGEFVHVTKPMSRQYSFLGRRGVGFAKSELPNYRGASSPGFDWFITFLRKIVVNGLFRTQILPYSPLDRASMDIMEFLNRKDSDVINLMVLRDLVKFTRKEGFKVHELYQRMQDSGTQTRISEYGKGDDPGR